MPFLFGSPDYDRVSTPVLCYTLLAHVVHL